MLTPVQRVMVVQSVVLYGPATASVQGIRVFASINLQWTEPMNDARRSISVQESSQFNHSNNDQ